MNTILYYITDKYSKEEVTCFVNF